MRMAGLAAGIARHRRQPRIISGVAHVVEQRPGAVERGRPEVFLVPGHHVAGRIADPAADAFDPRVGGAALRRLRGHHREILPRPRARLEITVRFLPFVEEPRHLDRQILDHGEIAQWLEPQRAIGARNFGYARAAGPARPAVHHHGAGSAHADPAGEAVGERGILVALDLGDDVEHGLIEAARHIEGLERAGVGAAPDVDSEIRMLLRHRARFSLSSYAIRWVSLRSTHPTISSSRAMTDRVSSPAACEYPRRRPPASSSARPAALRCGA